jgi:hypothetical protein
MNWNMKKILENKTKVRQIIMSSILEGNPVAYPSAEPIRRGPSMGNRGSSFVQVLILSGALVYVMMTLLSATRSQQQDIKGLQQKSEATEFKNLLVKTLSNSSVCTPYLKDMVVDVANATTTTASPTVLNLSDIYYGTLGTSAPLASAGKVLPLSQYGLVVDKISFKNILATGNPGEYKGNFEVSFTSGSIARPLHPVQSEQIIKIATDGSNRIVSCYSASSTSSGGLNMGTCIQREAPTVTKIDCGIEAVTLCESNEVAITGSAVNGSNTSLQNSEVILNAQSKGIGWRVSWYATKKNCDDIDGISNGTTAPGASPCLCNPSLPPESCFCGSGTAYCCKEL